MKLDINELDFIKECIFNSTIKGKDSVFVGGLLSKIFKEVDKLKILEQKKEVVSKQQYSLYWPEREVGSKE